MPLFMFLSGFLVWGKEISLKKKFLALVLPFLAWFIVGMALTFIAKGQVDVVRSTLNLLRNPDVGLWFLWVLFLNFCSFKLVSFLAAKFGDTTRIMTFISVYLVMQTIPIHILGFDALRWHFLFFGLGYFFAKYRTRINITPKYLVKIFFLILFPLFALMWYRVSPPAFTSLFIGVTSTTLHTLNGFLISAFIIITPLLGIGFVWSLVPESGGRIYKLLAKLGMISLDIYVVNRLLLLGNSTVELFLSALILSILISLILNRFKITRTILYGRAAVHLSKNKRQATG